MPRLEFRHTYNYASHEEGVWLPVRLRTGYEKVNLVAQVDTGASHCVFEREYGKDLSLDIEGGDPRSFSTATGRIHAFGHIVSLEVLDITFESMVYFFADEGVEKNLLGRTGWLDRVRLGVVHYDRTLYLAPYDFQG